MPCNGASLSFKTKTMKYILLTIFILIMTMVISQVFIAKNTDETGMIPFETIKKYDNFEIRSYPELMVATTNLSGTSYSENARSGFRTIASYIFGGNKDNKQIAMTSPVQMSVSENSNMSFFMPPSMKAEDLPQPDNSDVVIQNKASNTVAVIQFSGWASDEILEQKFIELKIMLLAEGIEFENEYSYLGYNPPYQLINRLNEVVIELISYKK